MEKKSATLTGVDIESFTAATQAKAWPFEEAQKIIKRYEKRGFPEQVTFETGYGPSGLPHIGTFGEVARTSMVRHAFHILTQDQVKTRILCFSDDMDGLRKVPDNVPNREEMAAFLGKPLTKVPDPFMEGYSSFGAANNARLCAFLDHFGFDYQFASATDYYTSGRFDETLLRMLAVYDEVMAIILPHGVLFRDKSEERIRRKLLQDGHIDTVIGLPAKLFYSTDIPVCILVLKKCKKPDDVLFINASEQFEKGKKQNRLLPEHIHRIVETYQHRKEAERYSRRVSMKEIEQNDFNLNISRYVSTVQAEEEIDLAAVHAQLTALDRKIKTATTKHNRFLKELGLPLLP